MAEDKQAKDDNPFILPSPRARDGAHASFSLSSSTRLDAGKFKSERKGKKGDKKRKKGNVETIKAGPMSPSNGVIEEDDDFEEEERDDEKCKFGMPFYQGLERIYTRIVNLAFSGQFQIWSNNILKLDSSQIHVQFQRTL